MERVVDSPRTYAYQLVRNFYAISPYANVNDNRDHARKCALLSIEQLIREVKRENMPHRVEYWEKVKQEIPFV